VISDAKLFSGAPTTFGADPNTQVSLVDAGMPGMLPVINKRCVEQAVRTGLGLNAKINLRSVFDRKNYFYADLPAGYQISQYKDPIVGEGEVEIELKDGVGKKIGIERLHLEQDAAKLLNALLFMNPKLNGPKMVAEYNDLLKKVHPDGYKKRVEADIPADLREGLENRAKAALDELVNKRTALEAADSIHTEPQGLMYWGGPFFTMNPSWLLAGWGLAGVLSLPLAVLMLGRARREAPAAAACRAAWGKLWIRVMDTERGFAVDPACDPEGAPRDGDHQIPAGAEIDVVGRSLWLLRRAS
jgi:hypothetical protein